MHILVDLDGTIADWGKQYDHDLDNWRQNGVLSGEVTKNIPRTASQKAFNLHEGRTNHESMIITAIMDRKGFYADLEPISGAIEALHEMVEAGHEVSIVTSPWLTNPTCVQDKLDWVRKYLGAGWEDRVIITKDKTLVDGDVLIDDKGEITGKVASPRWTHVLFDQPYNQYVKDKLRLTDWADWASIAELAAYLAKHKPVKNVKPVLTGSGLREDISGYVKRSVISQEGFVPAEVTDKWVKGSEVRSVSSTGGEKGTKDERHDLIPFTALRQLAEHYGVGARKYDDWQWRKGYEWSKSYAALQRHATQFWNGEDFDEETGSNHMAAVAWHAFTLLTFFEEFPEFDDRFKREVE